MSPESATKVPPLALHGFDGAIHEVALTADRRYALALGNSGLVRRWNAQLLETRDAMALNGARARAFSPDGRYLLTGHANFYGGTSWIALADLQRNSLESIRTEPSLLPSVNGVSYLPEAGLLAAADGATGLAQVWPLDTSADAQPLLFGYGRLEGPRDISPDGQYVANGGPDRATRLWRVSAADPLAGVRILRGHSASVIWVRFSPDGQLLASAAADGRVQLWGLGAGGGLRIMQGPQGAGYSFSADGSTLVARGSDGTVALWDVRAADPQAGLRSWRAAGGGSGDLHLSRDARRLA